MSKPVKYLLLLAIATFWNVHVSYCQCIKVSSNLPGKYVFSFGFESHKEITLSDSSYFLIPTDTTVEIEYRSGLYFTAYEIDTRLLADSLHLHLIFEPYQQIELHRHRSGTLSGSVKKNRSSKTKVNRGAKTTDHFPDSIFVSTNFYPIVFHKTIMHEYQITSGNGRRKGGKWGFSESMCSSKLIYKNR